jgi:uncharacterized protein YyaL (SSP411 family)
VATFERESDPVHGGFGQKPKFPHASALQFLLRMSRRTGRSGVLNVVQLNLDKMARGGIYDHLGGGVARYSVDERWLVPHFEKMLYDNALLAGAYLDGYLATGRGEYGGVVRETLDYVLRSMTEPNGGFHSSEDADSEGEEGKFYLWTRDEILAALGRERGERFCYVYDVTEEGNFEDRNILNLPKSIAQCAAVRGWEASTLRDELTDARRVLLEIRDRRIRPGKDDKVLVSWNALMIDSLARAAGALDEPRYLVAAARCAAFLLRDLRRADGRLLHSWRGGQARFDAYLDDYAFLIQALVTLYEADFAPRWIDAAVQLADLVLKHFSDPAGGGFYYTADDHEPLIARTKDVYESSIPSGNGMAATALLRLGRLAGRPEYIEAARGVLAWAVPSMQRAPSATAQMLMAAMLDLGPQREIAILGDPHSADTAAALSDLRKRFVPDCLVACRRPGPPHEPSALDSLFAGKHPAPPEPTVFVCENFACQTPVSGVPAALDTWKRLAAGG